LTRLGRLSLLSLLAVGLAVGLTTSGCSLSSGGDEPCPDRRSTLDSSGARHVLDVPLPFRPGPMTLVTHTEQGFDQSRSSRLWLGEGGLSLYAIHDDAIWRLDLATLDRARVAAVGQRAARITGSRADDTLLFTDPLRGELWVLDQTHVSEPVRIEVGAGPTAVALGPGRRLAYVANEYDRSVSLVETGVGVVAQGDRSLLVASAGTGELLELDGDGRTRERYGDLPGRLDDLLLLEGGRELVASFSELLTTGEPGTLGDGELVIDEGLVLLDRETGEIQRWSLHRQDTDDQPTEHEADLARPTGLVPLAGGRQVAVALPGWSEVAVMDTAPDSPTRGQVVREIPVPGEPRWLVAAELAMDWLYVLDERAATVYVLDAKGDIAHEVSLQ